MADRPEAIPADNDLELEVISTILNNPSSAEAWCNRLLPEDIAGEKTNAIFRSIRRISESGQPITIQTLRVDLAAHDDLTKIGGIAWVTEIGLNVPAVVSMDGAVLRLRELTQLRAIQKLGYQLISGVIHAPETVLDTLERSVEKLNETAVVDVSQYSAARFFEIDPPEIKWTLWESLPRGNIGYIAGKSGVGKSYLVLDMLISKAVGIDVLGGIYRRTPEEKVIYMAGEDAEGLLHIRIKSILDNKYPKNQYPEARAEVEKKLSENLFIISTRGCDWRLTRLEGQNLVQSSAFDRFSAICRSVQGLGLVVIDPFSRFYAGNENDNGHLTYFSTMLERITIFHPDMPSVLVVMHSSKDSGKVTGRAALVQEAVRGGGGSVAAGRWTMVVVCMDRTEISQIQGDPNDVGKYLWVKCVKKNSGPPEREHALFRLPGGVLELIDPEKIQAKRCAESVDDAGVIDRIIQILNKGDQSYTRRTFRDKNYKILGRTKAETERDIEQALESEKIYEIEDLAKNGIIRKYLSAQPF